VSEPKTTIVDSANVAQEWDRQILRLRGHLLQSSRWGAFKTRHGWEVERIAFPDIEHPRAMAQVLFKSRGPVSMGYIPRGPAFQEADGEAVIELFRMIDRVAKKRRAINLIVEPNQPLPLSGTFKDHDFVRGPHAFQPSRTVIVPLLDDEPLLSQMHQKTRYSVRLATRRGVNVEQCSNPEHVEEFYRLLEDTSSRNEFGIHSLNYYRDFVDIFGDHAHLSIANYDGHVAAGLIAARFGDDAIYMYGGSSTEHRAHGAAYLLQFTAMQWARNHGARTYDLWGIPDQDPESTGIEGGLVAGTKGDDWRGLYKFKVGFGGQIVRFPMTMERRYSRFLSMIARKSMAHRE
jgi:lipid II:glycine glycyltransferase (peptidoglycan interpeptide bridge formation enzyme)